MLYLSNKSTYKTISFILKNIYFVNIYIDIYFTDGWGYAKVSGSCRKSDSDRLAYINWMTSSRSSHKQWFYMVDTNNSAGSEAQLLNYLNVRTYYPGHTFGHYFELKSKREHVIDPETRVTGYWNP